MARAIVVGGSVAGMGAARALADSFDEVFIVDRDRFPDTVAHRAGAPQSRHAHALLERGKLELEALFPGFVDAMRAGGADQFDPGLKMAVRRAGGWQEVGPHATELLFSSRTLLEFTVRELLRAQTRVQLLERTQVVGLSVAANRRVRAVKLRNEAGELSELAADLVVDASGRNTHADDWLRELGLTPPDCDRVDAHLGYASRFYQAPAPRPASWWWKCLWIEWEPPSLPRAGVIFPLEGDRWLVTLGGVGAHMPPTDEAGFGAFMRTLSSPALAEAVALAQPISAISGNRSLANVFRRYDRWRERLPGFLSLGDATCAFNPIYGQGMSTAAACATLLREHLRRFDFRDQRFETAFFKRQARFVKGPWELATGADFMWPDTEGVRPPPRPLVGAYLRLMTRAMHGNAALRRQIYPVFNLTGPATLFFAPKVVTRVLLDSVQRRLREQLHAAVPVPDAPPG